MKPQYSFLLAFPLILAMMFLYFNIDRELEEVHGSSINSVIGDESYMHVFGDEPGEDVPDHTRIQVHLDYVEGVLRNRSTDHLSTEQKKNRLRYLDLLRDYIAIEKFPYNDGHPDPRRPVFISDNGHICAVGWLVKQTAGMAIVEEINQTFKYDYIPDIDHPTFLKWVEKSGFTIDELAMIQPQYGSIITEQISENRNHLNRSFSAGTALTAAGNALYFSNRAGDPWMFSNPRHNHWFGLAAGSASVVFGLMNINNSYTYNEPDEIFSCMFGCTMKEITHTNHLRSGVAAANIGVGVLSAARAGYHLVRGTGSQPKEPSRLGVTHLVAETDETLELVPALTYRISF